MSHYQDRLAAECHKNAENYDFYLKSIEDIRSKIKTIRYEDLALDFSTHAKEIFFEFSTRRLRAVVSNLASEIFL